MLAQRHRRWLSITSALSQCIVLSGDSGAGMKSITRITIQQSENTVQLPNAVSMSGQHRRLWVNIETQHWVNVTCLRKLYNRPSDELVLGQRRRRLTGIEQAMGCDAG